MSESLPSYSRAIFDAWREDVKLSAIDWAKAVRSGLIGIVAGLIVALSSRKMETAADAALTTAIVLGVALVVTMVAHMTWSWATAPRRVYYQSSRKIRELSDQIIERDAAIAQLKAPKTPKTRPGTRNDIVKEFQRFVERGIATPHKLEEAVAWRDEIIAYVESHLDCPDAKEFRNPPREYTQVQPPNDTERAKHCLGWYIGRLQGWTNAFLQGKLDHCIAEFYVPVKDASG